MQVIDYLKTNGLEALKEELGIGYVDYPDFVVLNYSQIDSPKNHPIVKECRSLILDKHSWNVLSRTFDRFMNHHEDMNRDSFDISKAVCFDKIDGSLIPFWYNPYAGKHQFATRSMAFAEGNITFGGSETFNDLIPNAFGIPELSKEFLESLPKDMTYVFEFVSPKTRIVTPYKEYALYFLSARNTGTGIEVWGDEWDTTYEMLKVGIPALRKPNMYRFGSLEEIIQAMKGLGPTDEGYVCAIQNSDGSIWRIKIKNPVYLAISKRRGNGLTHSSICELVWENDEGEYLGYFPEDQGLFDPYIEARKLIFTDLEVLWEKYKDIENQKDFALAVKGYPVCHFLFARKNGRSIEDHVKGMTGNAKEKLLVSYLPG
jgi:hypothetical protein